MPEHHSNRLSQQLALTYFLQSINTTLQLHAGTAFKLPSFFALGNSIVGNPSLKPETSNNVSLSTTTDFFDQKIRFETSTFFSKYEDLVDFSPGPPPQLVNRSNVDIFGSELNLRLNINSKFSMTSSISYSENNIKNSREELLNRPDWQALMLFNWQPRENVNLSFQASHIGRIHDSAIPSGLKTLDDYTRFDTAVEWNIHSTAKLRAAVDNLLDKDYDLAIGVPANGITPRVNVSFSF